MRRPSVALVTFALLATGCASEQLDYNTVDIASTIGDIYTQQALNNLSKTIDFRYSIPSEADIAAGTIQTSNSITPTLTFPLSNSFMKAAGATTTKTFAIAGSSLGIGASDAWQQNWTVSPVTDSNALRNLQALYRSVIDGPEVLKSDYQPSRMFDKDGKFGDDPYYLQEPHCVLCTDQKIPNKKLGGKWLYWTTVSHFGAPSRMPSDNPALRDLGHFGNHELYIREDAYDRGDLANFVLFTMPNAEPPQGAAGAPSGRPAGGAAGAPGGGRSNFNLILPQAILPPQ